MARSPQAGAQEAIHESLQGIVRHQLEMLVTPALRWEGDVWSGLFMALLIQPPTGHQASRDGAEDDAPEGDSQRTWRSDIDLDLEGIGRIKASVWMQASRLEIDMHIIHNDTLERLQAGLPALKARLNAHGFEEVSATLAPLAKETPDAQP
ncbi:MULTISPECIES: flagellar hook-length control protein FliK [unclassified Halomonas]|uniref:flagellar hook-length control protein FliK n=1 Tax=unclassified Halomonas TaxID=2609666 RepID=UPI0028868DF5|nr:MULTISPECIES: flagellar hook-length control protein FliK [unclassified Halomonas]MDT0500529.1 flagellar hook-length control protein FliK [Halomonas sp. PAR7]MDT0511575.1 flagellar hook-length control protein FliK [Halomonas sp. LES1]MDT0590137.1 flagellar hook-length control protein FliK [Halomonas sp. PAR8]